MVVVIATRWWISFSKSPLTCVFSKLKNSLRVPMAARDSIFFIDAYKLKLQWKKTPTHRENCRLLCEREINTYKLASDRAEHKEPRHSFCLSITEKWDVSVLFLERSFPFSIFFFFILIDQSETTHFLFAVCIFWYGFWLSLSLLHRWNTILCFCLASARCST